MNRLRKVLRIVIDSDLPPTLRDIAHGADISSTSVVNYYLDRLALMGYIEKTPNISRGIKYTGKKIEARDFIKGAKYHGKRKAKAGKSTAQADTSLYTGRRRDSEWRGKALCYRHKWNRQPNAR